jgi:hypothetical protein
MSMDTLSRTLPESLRARTSYTIYTSRYDTNERRSDYDEIVGEDKKKQGLSIKLLIINLFFLMGLIMVVLYD